MAILVILSDEVLLAECLARSLEGAGVAETTVAGTGSTVEELAPLDAQAVILRPASGSSLASECSSISVLAQLDIPVLVLTDTEHDPLLGYCLELGAAGIISGHEPFERLAETVAAALRGEPVNSDQDKVRWLMAAASARREHAARTSPFDRLTSREAEVLGALTHGLSVEEIASVSVVSVLTVRSQVRNIFQKLGVRSQLAAVAMARRARWDPPPTTPGAPNTWSEIAQGGDAPTSFPTLHTP